MQSNQPADMFLFCRNFSAKTMNTTTMLMETHWVDESK